MGRPGHAGADNYTERKYFSQEKYMKSLSLIAIVAAALCVMDCHTGATSINHIRRQDDDCAFIVSIDGGNLFVTGAMTGETGGGEATADKMCIYYFKPDTAGEESSYTGSTWPYVIVPKREDSDSACNIQFESDLEKSKLKGRVSINEDSDALLINGRHVYFFTKDEDNDLCTGNSGTWASIDEDGDTTEGAYEVEPLKNAKNIVVGDNGDQNDNDNDDGDGSKNESDGENNDKDNDKENNSINDGDKDSDQNDDDEDDE
ncbi:hypothetical protein SARC_02036 [Sphaeroforma arctica JP610]|uniref:Uncharacterized protein n=1 Tax=Sphaeroforma arctica JP610 TaxID=667725 RepID=A0A0L0G9V4_9EUKA|nr:hypothetical protein SARC_02036 [Sphaeroforma arctica JP610]KNC85812.1 hypothetical protein SARC_02036 [Sphaeroforma arctica JP610]|eukprot:XP_014159714.1 hypothetical protein SARC_02036 [Sphaeroforma arctica JP610]